MATYSSNANYCRKCSYCTFEACPIHDGRWIPGKRGLEERLMSMQYLLLTSYFVQLQKTVSSLYANITYYRVESFVEGSGMCSKVIPELIIGDYEIKKSPLEADLTNPWWNDLCSGEACRSCRGSCGTNAVFFRDVLSGDGIVGSPHPSLNDRVLCL